MNKYFIVFVFDGRWDFSVVLGEPAVSYQRRIAARCGASFLLVCPDGTEQEYRRIFPAAEVRLKSEWPLKLEKPCLAYLTSSDTFHEPSDEEWRSLDLEVSWKDVSDLAAAAGGVSLSSAADLYRFERDLQQTVNGKLLDSGVKFLDLGQTWVGPDVCIAPDATLGPGTFIVGESKVEEGASVFNSRIVDSIIGEGATAEGSVIEKSEIKARTSVVFSHIVSSTVGSDSRIGPFARLRGHNELAAGAVVGNFVELKNTSVDEGVKIKHLTYLGDTSVGKNANIGCGVITANYDGRRKYKTAIGAGTLVGCNSTLVAPLTVGAESYIAAGSTVTADVGEGDLAIARSRQVNKAGYALASGLRERFKEE